MSQHELAELVEQGEAGSSHGPYNWAFWPAAHSETHRRENLRKYIKQQKNHKL
jgi:hypothetical protein